MAAALVDPVPFQTLDLRSVDVETLAPLLAEQIASWKTELDWDFTPSANLVRRFVQMHVLTGHALISRAAASNARMNSRPIILRFVSGSLTPASAVRNTEDASTT